MWTEKTKNNKYKHVERYKDPITGETNRVSITTEKNTPQARKSAQRFLMAKIDTLLDEKNVSDITLAKLREKWLADKKRYWKASSYTTESRNSRKVVEMLGEASIVNNLTARYVSEHIISPDEDVKLANQRIKIFKQMINWGYMNDYVIDKSYLEKLKNRQPSENAEEDTEEDIEEKYLESWEAQKLINEMKNTRWITLTRFLILTGMRVGEALALTADDIDLAERYIHIHHTYDHANRIVSNTPKTKASKRKIYIQDEVLSLAKELKKEALANKLIYGQSFVFMQHGHPIYYETYRHYLKKSGQEILNRKITPHTLRHTHTSLLAEQEVDIETISRRLGHEDSHITKKIYLHVTKKMRSRDNQRVREIKIL